MHLSVFSLVSLAGLAVATPAQAFTVDFSSSPWESIGNVSFPAAGEADLATENGVDATFSPELQTFLELNSGDLDLNIFDVAFGGSAFKRQVIAGDQIAFDWSFALDPDWDAGFFPLPDYAFIASDGAVEILATSTLTGSFSRTFANDGLFGIGVVDIGDATGNSTLAITNANFETIPTPAMLPGLIGMGLAVLRKQRQQEEA